MIEIKEAVESAIISRTSQPYPPAEMLTLALSAQTSSLWHSFYGG